MQQDKSSFDTDLDKLIDEFCKSNSSTPEKFDGTTARPSDASNTDQDDPIPERVSRFDVIEQIGTGGLGLILRVRDTRLDREVAVKILQRRHLNDPELVTQFLREAKITARLQHPGVIPIHDSGETAAGLPYFVMRIIEGSTLSELLHDQLETIQHPVQRVLRIFEKTCETIAYAHTHRIVHRDLKPQNIMVSAFGEVKILDWGFATDYRANGAQSRRIVGTPAYMAPEQARGDSRIDCKSDIFSLGAILCEILTGAPPYLAETTEEIFLKARMGWLDDAHQRLDAVVSDPLLLELVYRCLDPEPAKRPHDATSLGMMTAWSQSTTRPKSSPEEQSAS